MDIETAAPLGYQEYRETHRVDIFDAGPTGELRLSSLLCLCQNTAWEHMERLGVGYAPLRRDGIVFLVVSTKAEVTRMPKYGEEIQIRTFPLGSRGVTFYRGFEIFGEDGKLAVFVLQSSVCVDPEKHTPLRPKVFYEYGVFPEEKTPDSMKIPRAHPQEDMPLLGTRTVRYSDLDCNGHMNNTVYGDITEDFLPLSRQEHTYAQVQIDYVNEARLGEEILLRGKEENGTFLLQGFHPRGLCFSAQGILLPR